MKHLTLSLLITLVPGCLLPAAVQSDPSLPVAGHVNQTYIDLSHLRKFKNKYPHEAGLFEDSALKKKMKEVLGNKYDLFIFNMEVTGPIEVIDNTLILEGMAKHSPDSDEAMLAVDLSGSSVYTAFITTPDNKTSLYVYLHRFKNAPTPEPFISWIKEKQLAGAVRMN